MKEKDKTDFVERNRAKVDAIIEQLIRVVIPAVVSRTTGQITLDVNLSQGGVGQSYLNFKRPLDLKHQIKK